MRLYGATDWITTKLNSTGPGDYLAANARLKDYVKRQTEAGTSRTEVSLEYVIWFVMAIAKPNIRASANE